MLLRRLPWSTQSLHFITIIDWKGFFRRTRQLLPRPLKHRESVLGTVLYVCRRSQMAEVNSATSKNDFFCLALESDICRATTIHHSSLHSSHTHRHTHTRQTKRYENEYLYLSPEIDCCTEWHGIYCQITVNSITEIAFQFNAIWLLLLCRRYSENHYYECTNDGNATTSCWIDSSRFDVFTVYKSNVVQTTNHTQTNSNRFECCLRWHWFNGDKWFFIFAIFIE